jgi:hypothetical protein
MADGWAGWADGLVSVLAVWLWSHRGETALDIAANVY